MTETTLLHLSQGKTHPYIVKKSKRAKYIRIKLSHTGELSVVVPYKASLKQAHKFIKSKVAWIEKQLEKISDSSLQLPECLDLPLIDEKWSVRYLDVIDNTMRLTECSGSILDIQGPISDISLVKKTINQWCKKKASHIFNEMLEALAEKHGFHYNRLTVRSQKTRWGSCSINKNISLNSKLLFFPEEIVSYVMVHELCHTIEMNHSHRFWNLVEECDPNYHTNRKALKEQSRHIFL